jgi:hypothetical protein
MRRGIRVGAGSHLGRLVSGPDQGRTGSMRTNKPKLKVDRIFGPELVPARRWPIGGVVLGMLLMVGVVGLYHYGSPIWLRYNLQQKIKATDNREVAGLAAANLLMLGDAGLAIVVETMADPRVEVAEAAYQVLRSELESIPAEEVTGSPWVTSLAALLKRNASDWRGESREWGCRLASHIFQLYASEVGVEEVRPAQWPTARLDCWAILESHDWTGPSDWGTESRTMMVSSGSSKNMDNSLAGTSNLLRPSGLTAGGESRSSVVSSSVSNAGGARASFGDLAGDVPMGERAPSRISSGSPDALAVGEYEKREASAERSGAVITIGQPQLISAGEEPMAHIQVVPKKRLARSSSVATESYVVDQSADQQVSEGTEARFAAKPIGEGSLSSSTNASAEKWEGNIQTIDAHSPQDMAELEGKDVLELIGLLKSSSVSTQAAAVRALERQGMSSTEIELASELVRGDTARRKELLMNLPQMDISDPTPWYVWMAQNEDREVRRVAIRGLASVSDPSVAKMVRDLKIHERDRELRDLLQSILDSIGR